MGRLVEVLAAELKEWPEDITKFTCDPNGEIRGEPMTRYDFYPKTSVDLNERTKELAGLGDDLPFVDRAQWQAERDRQKGGEWKRHRGNGQPVTGDAFVQVKLRCGDIQNGYANQFLWKYTDCDESVNIMKYRVVGQPQAEEVEVIPVHMMFGYESKEAMIAQIGEVSPFEQIISEMKTDQIDGPIKWRDCVIHCQAIIEDCEREIERNVQLLDAEGLMMQKDSKKAMQHYATDVLPFKEWRVGDIVEVISTDTFCDPECSVGDQMPIIAADHRDDTVKVVAGAWGDENNYRFIRRP